jgi:hypothetical protein
VSLPGRPSGQLRGSPSRPPARRDPPVGTGAAPVLGIAHPAHGRAGTDWAHPAHICAGTGLTSAPGFGPHLPGLRRCQALQNLPFCSDDKPHGLESKKCYSVPVSPPLHPPS